MINHVFVYYYHEEYCLCNYVSHWLLFSSHLHCASLSDAPQMPNPSFLFANL